MRHPSLDGTKGTRNSLFAVSSDNLPLIAEEGKQIEKLFSNVKAYYNEAANRETLISELQNSDGFVHIAAHAARASENPLFSRILLGDGPFFPFDLFGSGIKARLVTLSGCQTAAPGLYYGNSFSLAKAFYQAGSRFVLASLWPVSDRLSMIFMKEFYKKLAEGDDIFSAYKTALTNTQKVVDNPAFWAAFILLGT